MHDLEHEVCSFGSSCHKKDCRRWHRSPASVDTETSRSLARAVSPKGGLGRTSSAASSTSTLSGASGPVASRSKPLYEGRTKKPYGSTATSSGKTARSGRREAANPPSQSPDHDLRSATSVSNVDDALVKNIAAEASISTAAGLTLPGRAAVTYRAAGGTLAEKTPAPEGNPSALPPDSGGSCCLQ